MLGGNWNSGVGAGTFRVSGNQTSIDQVPFMRSVNVPTTLDSSGDKWTLLKLVVIMLSPLWGLVLLLLFTSFLEALLMAGPWGLVFLLLLMLFLKPLSTTKGG